MTYYDCLNPEIRQYFDILAKGDFPYFIDKYVATKPLQRLAGIGFLCGIDYTNLYVHEIKHWYSRLDHSIGCALITWSLTKDKKQTLCALFHDLGTPAFSHAVDFMLNDPTNQTSSEKQVTTIIQSSDEIMSYLKSDGIQLEEVDNPMQYPIVDCPLPGLCADRVESILSTNFIWVNQASLKEIEILYKMVCVGRNENNDVEIALDDLGEYVEENSTAEPPYYSVEYFFCHMIDLVYQLQSKKNKIALKLLGDILKIMVAEKIIEKEDLYQLSEAALIEKMKNSPLSDFWHEYTKISRVRGSKKDHPTEYCYKLEIKPRIYDPLISIKDEDGTVTVLTRMSGLSDYSVEEVYKAYSAFGQSNKVYAIAGPSEPSGQTLRKIKEMTSSHVA